MHPSRQLRTLGRYSFVSQVNQFLDIEAEVSSEDDVEDEEVADRAA